MGDRRTKGARSLLRGESHLLALRKSCHFTHTGITYSAGVNDYFLIHWSCLLSLWIPEHINCNASHQGKSPQKSAFCFFMIKTLFPFTQSSWIFSTGLWPSLFGSKTSCIPIFNKEQLIMWGTLLHSVCYFLFKMKTLRKQEMENGLETDSPWVPEMSQGLSSLCQRLILTFLTLVTLLLLWEVGSPPLPMVLPYPAVIMV